MSKLSICHASLLESYLSVKLAICQSYLFVMLATCHSYMSKQLAHLVPVLRKFLVKLPLIRNNEALDDDLEIFVFIEMNNFLKYRRVW